MNYELDDSTLVVRVQVQVTSQFVVKNLGLKIERRTTNIEPR
ncbi:hypothetical protein [Desulfosporosinus sp. OT]|nr:hypothetical protein [Desulfosporosinus sp. OT]